MDLYEDIFEVTEIKTGDFEEHITEEEIPNRVLIFALFCINRKCKHLLRFSS